MSERVQPGGPARQERRRVRRLAAALLGLALFAAALAVAQEVQLEARVFEIAGRLRCPVCVSESVADSNSQIAVQMRELIQQQLGEGRSDDEIYAYFQARYGDWIMLDPPKRGVHLLVWLLPVVALVIAVATLGLLARRWLKAAKTPIVVDPEDLERVRRQLDADEEQAQP